MASDPIATDLKALHRAIEQGISERFPDFKTVEFYRWDDRFDTLTTPACLLELDEFEPHEDSLGTEQFPVSLRFVARLIFSCENGPTVPLELRLAAVALCAFINENNFGNAVAPARIVQSEADHFRPDLNGQFAIWRIEWVHHEAAFGESIWSNDGSVPVRVLTCNNDDMAVYDE